MEGYGGDPAVGHNVVTVKKVLVLLVVVLLLVAPLGFTRVNLDHLPRSE